MSMGEIARGLRALVGASLAVAVCLGTASGANAKAWRTQTLNRPGGSLQAVSCPSARLCMAVGMVDARRARAPASRAVTLAELWSGSRWRRLSTRNGLASSDTELTGVSCSSRTACTAVGFARARPAVTTEPFVERWDGLRWSIQRTPPVADGFFNAVSCAAADACTAVGGLGSYPNNEKAALIERWNGSRWRIQRLPAMARPAVSETLTAVSCPAPQGCMAVGAAFDQSEGSQLVALGGSGPVWTNRLQQRGFNFDFLNGVSCVSSRRCFAVGGGFERDGSTSWSTSTSWNGTRWSPVRDATIPNVLQGVSCRSAKACTAVGGTDGLHVGGFAGRWNGQRWASVDTVSSSFNAELNGDSCPSTTRCVAVGRTVRGSSLELPLVAVRGAF